MLIIKKERDTLRKWKQCDATSLSENLNNKNIWDNCRDYLPYPYSLDDANSYLESIKNKEPLSDFCIEINGEAVGNIGFVRGNDVERYNAEVGYWMVEKHWNKGIITDALKEAIKYYVANSDIARVFAPVYQDNIASKKVLEKVGFKEYGIAKKGAYKNGRFIDLCYYELLIKK